MDVGPQTFELKIAALNALGEIGSYGEEVMRFVEDNHAHVRAAASIAVGKIAKKSEPSSDMADKVAGGLIDKCPVVRASAAEALGMMGDEGAAFTEEFVKLFSDTNYMVRCAAIKALAGG